MIVDLRGNQGLETLEDLEEFQNLIEICLGESLSCPFFYQPGWFSVIIYSNFTGVFLELDY